MTPDSSALRYAVKRYSFKFPYYNNQGLTPDSNDIFEIIKKKMNFGDALILKTAIDNHINMYVGWNIRHFKAKAKMIFYTPADYLEAYEKI